MGAQETSEITMDATAPISVRCSDWLDAIVCGDCLNEMPKMPAQSVDAIISDLPYGTTACKWDSVIPFAPLWAEWKRLLRPGGAIVLTASQPFTSALVMSNPKMFKFCWVWDKVLPVGFQVAKYKPMMRHEDVAVFGDGRITYNPQMVKREVPIKGYATGSESSPLKYTDRTYRIYTHKGPQSIIVAQRPKRKGEVHPTQKPVELMRYLVRTYTNPGDVVLDPCCGSGTTCVAAKQEGRHYIGIEKEQRYADAAKQRTHGTLGMASNKALSESHEDEPQR